MSDCDRCFLLQEQVNQLKALLQQERVKSFKKSHSILRMLRRVPAPWVHTIRLLLEEGWRGSILKDPGPPGWNPVSAPLNGSILSDLMEKGKNGGAI